MKQNVWQIMAVPALLFTLACGAVGCATKHQAHDASAYMNLAPVEDAIYEALSREPVPLPVTTPYDSDKRDRGAYLRGFADGWHDVISGFYLHGFRETPSTLSVDLAGVWSAGYQAGYKPASDRWIQEFLRIRQE